MYTIGIKALRNQLSDYVRLAANGETVLVTERDRVVAELGPPRQDRSALLAEVLMADAIDKGLIRPPVTPSKAVPQTEKVAAWAEIARELEQDREDRRHNG